MGEGANKDLGPTPGLQLAWERGKVLASLEALFDRITKEAEGAMNWCPKAKRPKQRWAMTLRVLAIVFGTIAGIIPILTQIPLTSNGKPAIQPALASVDRLLGLVRSRHKINCAARWCDSEFL